MCTFDRFVGQFLRVHRAINNAVLQRYALIGTLTPSPSAQLSVHASIVVFSRWRTMPAQKTHGYALSRAEAERPACEILPVPDLVRGEVHPLGLSFAPGLEAVQYLAEHGKASEFFLFLFVLVI